MKNDHFVLTGHRVLLRPFEEDDIFSIQKIFNNLKTMEHLKSIAPSSGQWDQSDVRKRLQRIKKKTRERSALMFAVVHESDENREYVVGECGFTNIDLVTRSAEFGVILDSSVWKSGLATECLYLCFKYGIENLNLHRIQFGTSEDNVRVRNGLESLGIAVAEIKKDAFSDNGALKNDYQYAFSEDQWPEIKLRLQAKLNRA